MPNGFKATKLNDKNKYTNFKTELQSKSTPTNKDIMNMLILILEKLIKNEK